LEEGGVEKSDESNQQVIISSLWLQSMGQQSMM